MIDAFVYSFIHSFIHSFYLFTQAKLVSLAVGFSLTFGGLFAKTWRVYVIFTHGTKQKKVFYQNTRVRMHAKTHAHAHINVT